VVSGNRPAAGRRCIERVWAVAGRKGVGRHIAHRLVHDGETRQSDHGDGFVAGPLLPP
jgi:hypothetical protein